MITAKLIADSICNNKRITTLELEYPRWIHAELLTHRLFSRNAASSRAIPAAQMRSLVRKQPAMPVHWGRNQSGMQADNELTKVYQAVANAVWRFTAKSACVAHKALETIGLHKQVCNRILEPWFHIKVVVTATEWKNFLHLRTHKDAQPELRELASKIEKTLNASTPKKLTPGDWHLPYVPKNVTMSISAALKLSASCCAQVSYRKLDKNTKKANSIYERLIQSEPLHASPFEHQAVALPDDKLLRAMTVEQLTEKGVSHVDLKGRHWSGNFIGWGQYRKQIEGEAVWA